jgi:hypothetical protein
MVCTNQTKFTAKQLNKQAARAGKEEQTEKNKVKKVSLTVYVTLNEP